MGRNKLYPLSSSGRKVSKRSSPTSLPVPRADRGLWPVLGDAALSVKSYTYNATHYEDVNGWLVLDTLGERHRAVDEPAERSSKVLGVEIPTGGASTGRGVSQSGKQRPPSQVLKVICHTGGNPDTKGFKRRKYRSSYP